MIRPKIVSSVPTGNIIGSAYFARNRTTKCMTKAIKATAPAVIHNLGGVPSPVAQPTCKVPRTPSAQAKTKRINSVLRRLFKILLSLCTYSLQTPRATLRWNQRLALRCPVKEFGDDSLRIVIACGRDPLTHEFLVEKGE